jgi:hypothetical protein
VPDRQKVEQRSSDREAGKADEHNDDNGVPDKGHVAPQRRHHILAFHHGLTLPKRAPCKAFQIYPQRNIRPIISTLNMAGNADHRCMAAMTVSAELARRKLLGRALPSLEKAQESPTSSRNGMGWYW